MDDMDLKARQEEDLKRKLWKNQLNKRFRRNILLFLLSSLGLLAVVAIIVNINIDTITSGKISILLTVAGVGVVILSYIFGRCPHCDEFIDISFYHGHCPFCGESLEISKSLNQIEKKRQAESEKQNI